MSIGTRIAELRKQHRVSQEYLAEKLGVSRQAVSKWEQDLTHPDTGNLIKLAELFHVSVEYLATGKTEDPVPTERPAKHRFKWKKKHVAGIIVSAALCLVIAGIIRIATLPVDWDAGACAGGYATHIFNLYGDELVQNYLNASSKKRTSSLFPLYLEHRRQNGREGRSFSILIFNMRIVLKEQPPSI